MSKTLSNNKRHKFPTKNKTHKTHKRKHINPNFNNKNGFQTSIWGPMMWSMLHIISFNYPPKPTEEQKKQYMEFIKQLRFVLPCKKCRDNLTNNFKKLPITMKDMKSRETFSYYIYNLHELINKMLNKQSNLSFNDVRIRYEAFRAKCATPDNKLINKETGCTQPIYGKKSKCIIKIVPRNTNEDTFQVDKKCIL